MFDLILAIPRMWSNKNQANNIKQPACFTFFFHKYYIGSRHKSKYYRFWFNKEKKCTIVWKLTQPNSFILFIHGVRFFQLIKEYANKHGHFNVGKVNLKQKKAGQQLCSIQNYNSKVKYV